MRKLILILITFFCIISFVFSNAESPIAKIREHYKKFALYEEGEKFVPAKVYIRYAAFKYLGSLYLLVDTNRTERRLMLYGINNLFLYPIFNLETYNNYVTTLSIVLNRNEIISYIKFFLELQRYISNNIVYTKIDKPALIEKYGKYGGEGFKEKFDKYFTGEPFLSYNKLRDEYEVSLPTFTVINIDAYYRLRTTHAIVSSLGSIRKIWGKNAEYFIYNGERPDLTPSQVENFEKNIY
jgi:hypothetical protein